MRSVIQRAVTVRVVTLGKCAVGSPYNNVFSLGYHTKYCIVVFHDRSVQGYQFHVESIYEVAPFCVRFEVQPRRSTGCHAGSNRDERQQHILGFNRWMQRIGEIVQRVLRSPVFS